MNTFFFVMILNVLATRFENDPLVVLFFEGGIVEVDGDVGVFLGALHD